MADQKIASIFDFGKQRNKFWANCDKSLLDTQKLLLESEFLTSGKACVKPIFLVLGQDHIYKVTTTELKLAPLATMHLNFIDPGADHFVQLNSDDKLYGFRLQYQGKSIDIFLDNKKVYDQWRAQLRCLTLLDCFHDAFMVSKLIGKGSFAKVYLATRKENNQQYAVKAFSKTFMQQQHKGFESLLNEIRIMRKIDHPNVLKLHEVHETVNSVYFVIDIVNGGELLQRVRDSGFLSQEILQRLSFNLLSALSHLHSKKIAHRDLKPENLLLKTMDNSYEIILADFGLASFLTEDLLFKRCGTPGFVAPEILEYTEDKQLYDERCDVFSAGVILYILITGNQPFTGKDQKSILKSNKDCNIDFQDKLFKESSILLQDLVKLMLQKKAANRLTSHECLQHAYFKELYKETQQQAAQQKSLQSYDSIFQSALKQGSGDSQGSMTLQTRVPAYNGNLNSIDNMSESSNMSLTRFEQQKNTSVLGVSRFSQYSIRLTRQGSREVADIPITKFDSKKNIDYHKMAIQNSHKKHLSQIDQFDDQPINHESSEVSQMVKVYSSSRYIRIPDSIQVKTSTPKAKKV